MDIRFATVNDAPYLAEIYSQYINTPITMEFTAPTAEQFAQKIVDVQKNYPFLVCLKAGVIVGYAYAHRYRQREGFEYDVESSVYVDEKFMGRKAGSALYTALLDILKLQNVYKVYAFVIRPNLMSESMHISRGFVKIAVMEKTGYKLDAWHDMMVFEKSLNYTFKNPETFIPVGELSQIEIEDICKRAASKINL